MARRVVVIGAGMAGAAAAIAAKEAGAQVTLVARRAGATALGSGSWDIATSPTRSLSRQLEDGGDLKAAVKDVIDYRPHHPYAHPALAATDDAATEQLLIAAARSMTSKLDPYVKYQAEERNCAYATAAGTVKLTACVPRTAAGNLSSMGPGAKVLLIGLTCMHGYDAGIKALMLADICSRITGLEGIRFDADYVDYEPVKGRTALDNFEVARALDKPDDGLAGAIAEKAKGYDLVLLPPVFGIDSRENIDKLVEACAPAKVAEVLATDSSAPGLRLQKALEAAVSDAGVERSKQMVTRIRHTEGKADQVELEGGERLDVDAVVLATGRFITDGIVFDTHGVRCPLLPRAQMVSPVQAGHFASSDRMVNFDSLARQLLFNAGLVVDEYLRPLTHRQQPFGGVYAAGSVIGGYDFARTHCGAGVALATGRVAGIYAAKGEGDD